MASAKRSQGRALRYDRRWRSRPWLRSHAQGALASLGRLVRTPWATLMTVAVIGFALALPAGLHSLIHNFQQLNARWEGSATFTLFLKAEINDNQAVTLAEQLGDWPEIAALQVITKAEGLAQFRAHSGFDNALDALEENPLPAALILHPAPRLATPTELETLKVRLEKLPETDFAQLDLQWVQRLKAITEILSRAVGVVAALLALAVLLIVGNTIRLEIENRRAEIEIMEQVGATSAFIRRPFLYSGIWYGLFSGMVAWILVSLSLALLQGPVERLAALYQSGFRLSGPGALAFLLVLIGGMLLGFAGAWISVGRHLVAIEPE